MSGGRNSRNYRYVIDGLAISFCHRKNRYNKFLTKHPTSEMTKTLLLIPR